MDRDTLINELKSIIADYLGTEGLDLVDFIYRYAGRDLVLRILADKPQGGISIDECAYLNKEISRILDEKGILQEGYILEVCSPGLDRPLISRNDFLRCMNRRARFFLKEAINGKLELEGVINKVVDETVYIEAEDGIIEVPLSRILKAKQILEK